MEAVTYEVSEIRVAYTPQKLGDRPRITTSEDALPIFLQGIRPDEIGLREVFLVLYLNQNNRVLGMYRVSEGGITGTVADVRLILGVALKVAATSMLLCHNHPSGGLRPSRADEELTLKIIDAARYLDVRVLDHLIVEPEGGFFSFADEGLV